MVIPPNNQYTQTNRSDILGTLQGSFNIDLTKVLGKLRVTRMIQTNSQASLTTMTGYPTAFKTDGSTIYAVATPRLFKTSTLKANSAFVVEATSGFPADCDSGSDLEVFGNAVYVAANQKLYKFSGGSWANNALAHAGPYSMLTFAGVLYIANSTTIDKTTNGTTITSAFTPSSVALTPIFIRSTTTRIWIGTLNVQGGKALMLDWDGSSATATSSYRLEAQGALACVIKDDVPWIMDSNGRLMVFNGGTFIEKARLPLNDKTLLNATSTSINRFIHPNGMSVVNGKINLLIKNEIEDNVAGSGSTPEFCPSGIWEYDENIGLYHKYSLSYLPVGTNTITDWGQNRVSGVGALSEMKLTDTSASATGKLIVGATVYTNASSTDAGIFVNDTFDAVSGTTGAYATQGVGYIVTSKIESSSIEESWQKILLFNKKFLTATDFMVAKYRTSDVAPTEASITWVSTVAFTTSTDVSAYVVGDEVEITQGKGSGMCAHITAITAGSGGTYIIDLDETFTGVVAGTAKARFQKWIKLSKVTNQNVQFNQFAIGKISNCIQFKLLFVFSGPNEFNKALIINKAHQLSI